MISWITSLEPRVLIANCVGIFGILACIMIFQQTERKQLLIWKLIADCIWTVQYLILGAYSGAGVTLIAVARSIIFLRIDPNKKKGVGWLVGFLSVSVIVAALTWKSWWNIFSLTGSVLGITSYWIGKPRVSRILSFPISTAMLIYDFSTMAYMGMLNETMSMVSSVIGIFRHDVPARRARLAQAAQQMQNCKEGSPE
jgi:hypothetical protein